MKVDKVRGEVKLSDTYGQYLTFLLGNELYGFEVGNIKEVIEYSQITSITQVPRVPRYIKGVINLRGDVMPVIDLTYRFFKQYNNITRRTCIVIVEMADDEEVIHVGAMIDAVNSVININTADIEPPMGFSAKMRPDFIHGIGKVADNFAILLNIQTVLDIEEISNYDDFENSELRIRPILSSIS